MILLKFINGEIDLFGRYAQVEMFPTLKAQEGKGKFELRVTGPERGLALYVNWDASNPALHEAFRNLKVRQALSYAIEPGRDQPDALPRTARHLGLRLSAGKPLLFR